MAVTAGHKRCGRCRRTKPTDEFTIARSRPDGLSGWCRTCVAEANRPRNRARMRALAELRRRHVEEYRQLYQEYLKDDDGQEDR